MASPSRSSPGFGRPTTSSSRRRTPSPAGPRADCERSGRGWAMRGPGAGLVPLAIVLLGGCMVGPDYTKPSVPMTPAYKEAEGWKAAQPDDQLPRGQWWGVFGDPELHALEEEVATGNQNLKGAEARRRAA